MREKPVFHPNSINFVGQSRVVRNYKDRDKKWKLIIMWKWMGSYAD